MLENWCWMKEELKLMSCHYSQLTPEDLTKWQEHHPGEHCPPHKIPDEMLDSLIPSRDLGRALWYLHQLYVLPQLLVKENVCWVVTLIFINLDLRVISRFDMAIHNPRSHEDCKRLNPTELYNDLIEQLYFLTTEGLESRGHGHVTFGHLVSGYDAGFYSYLRYGYVIILFCVDYWTNQLMICRV